MKDYYWTRLIFDHFAYEPEVEAALNTLVVPDSVFLDGGANIGYWSVYISERLKGKTQVIAVEASSLNFQRLTENRLLNDSRFTCLHAALADVSGQRLEFAALSSHAAATLRSHTPQDLASPVEMVETISIDDIYNTYWRGFTGRIIIKLDVEGGEITAMAGAKKVLRHDKVAVIYEDHGNDPESRTTRHLIEDLGLKVFLLNTNGLREIRSAIELGPLKRNTRIGYNLLALPRHSSLLSALS